MKEAKSTLATGPPDVELSAMQRKSANKQINRLLAEFPGKRIVDLLPVLNRRFPGYVLAIALGRVERRMDDLPISDQVFLAGFKKSLGKAG